MREGVELEQVHADVGGLLELAEHVGDEEPGGPHLLDLGRVAQLDHVTSLLSADPGVRSGVIPDAVET